MMRHVGGPALTQHGNEPGNETFSEYKAAVYAENETSRCVNNAKNNVRKIIDATRIAVLD